MSGLLFLVPEMLQSPRGKWACCYSWHMPFHHNWVCMNEATFGKQLRMGAAGCQGNQPWIEDWNFQSCPLIWEKRERGWRLNQSLIPSDLISHVGVGKAPSMKIQKERVQRASSLGNQKASTCHHAEPQTPWGQKLICWGPCLVCLFIRLLNLIL